MITSGKFNSHFPLLGFDAVKNERGEYTGIYTPNKEELKQVEWIMSSFLRVDRYKALLDLCKERNIKSKLGKYFSRNNIRSLLTNSRYIGKWYRNRQNAGKRQSKLMPYERFTEVELSHGCVIDEGLWRRVQDKVKELDGSRAQATKHFFPLSGLLVFSDGSSFAGNSAWGSTRRSTYYYNNANKIRVRSEVFDAEAEKVLHHIAENTPEFKKSFSNYSARRKNSIGMLAEKIADIDTRLDEVMTERQNLDKRLTFLLQDGDLEMASSFRAEYKRQFSALNDEERELDRKKRHLQLMRNQLKETQDTRKNEWLERVNKALGYIHKKDWVSLRSTYRQIFEKVIIRRLDEAKVRLQFVLKNLSTPHSKNEVSFCMSASQATPAGLEPATSTLGRSCSIQLSYGA